MIKSGPGEWSLTASNTYSGGTTVTGGTLQLGNNAALGTGGLTANHGTVDLAGFNPTVASLSGAAGTITNSGTGNSVLTVNQTSATTFSGQLTDGATNTLGLALSGSGVLVLSGSNTYSGGTLVEAGTLVVASSEALADDSNLAVGTDALTAFGSMAAPSGSITAPAERATRTGTRYFGRVDCRSMRWTRCLAQQMAEGTASATDNSTQLAILRLPWQKGSSRRRIALPANPRPVRRTRFPELGDLATAAGAKLRNANTTRRDRILRD